MHCTSIRVLPRERNQDRSQARLVLGRQEQTAGRPGGESSEGFQQRDKLESEVEKATKPYDILLVYTYITVGNRITYLSDKYNKHLSFE